MNVFVPVSVVTVYLLYVSVSVPVNSLTASAIRPLWTVTESSESSAHIHCCRAMMDGCVEGREKSCCSWKL